MTTESDLKRLHETYVSLSGNDIPWGVTGYIPSIWFEWAKQFTESDLRMVLLHLNKQIQLKHRNPGCVRFTNLIQDTIKFSQELSEVKAILRNRRVETPRQHILASTGRYEPQQDRVKTPGQLMAENEALNKLLKLRDEL